jgi:thiosulfate reductase cytochrome b subunit
MTTKQTTKLVLRHKAITRLTHWITALAIFCLLMSGLNIFNAHPRLYWGHTGSSLEPAFAEILAKGDKGIVRLGSLEINTTGFLGVSADAFSAKSARAFPDWMTIPSARNLADARRWHFFFAWVLVLSVLTYGVASLFNGHFRHDLTPRRSELSLQHIWHDIVEHARLRFPQGEATLRYNILQKFAYIVVIFGLLPLVILTGLTMSPGMNAALPWLVDLFGGRQSARTLHFIAASGFSLFILIHLTMVVLAGPYNEIRSMITGRFAIKTAKEA